MVKVTFRSDSGKILASSERSVCTLYTFSEFAEDKCVV